MAQQKFSRVIDALKDRIWKCLYQFALPNSEDPLNGKRFLAKPIVGASKNKV